MLLDVLLYESLLFKNILNEINFPVGTKLIMFGDINFIIPLSISTLHIPPLEIVFQQHLLKLSFWKVEIGNTIHIVGISNGWIGI